MTKRQAYAVDAAVGCLLTWGSVPLMEALGVGDAVQGVVAMLGMCATCFMVGVIGAHYARKQKAEEESRGNR
jgi:hypothetical protein